VPKVTIQTISQHTGLSRGTVSRALNNRPDISYATRQRVLEACRQLNYAPSHIARALALGRSFAVTVLIEDLAAPFAVSFLRGVTARAEQEQYAVNVAELGHDPAEAARRIGGLVPEKIDCVLIAVALAHDQAAALAESLRDRVIIATAAVRPIEADVLAPDYIEAGRLAAATALRSAGPPLLLAERADPRSEPMTLGFREYCQSHGVNPDAVTRRTDSLAALEDGAGGALPEALAGAAAIAATSDALALQVMLLLARRGRMAGRDVALLGAGNHPVGAYVRPSLSTIDFSGFEIGQRAMDLALQRLAKTRMDSPQTILIPPTLVPRESTRNLN
jgi:LacI family transcriptional regulator